MTSSNLSSPSISSPSHLAGPVAFSLALGSRIERASAFRDAFAFARVWSTHTQTWLYHAMPCHGKPPGTGTELIFGQAQLHVLRSC